jgi:hypothetical protein
VASDINIVSFQSTLTKEGVEVTGTVWDVYKLGVDTPLCTNTNAHWHYAPNGRSDWEMPAQLPSYMGKLLIRSQNMARVTLRVGIIVVSIGDGD